MIGFALLSMLGGATLASLMAYAQLIRSQAIMWPTILTAFAGLAAPGTLAAFAWSFLAHKALWFSCFSAGLLVSERFLDVSGGDSRRGLQMGASGSG